MKHYLFKTTLAFVLAIVSVFAMVHVSVYAAITKLEIPQSYTLDNFFNAEYRKGDENVTAGSLEGGDGVYLYPKIYAVTDTDEVYVVDTYNIKQHTPIKHYDKSGKYIRTLNCELFTDGDILSMIAFGDILYVRTSDGFLCSFNTKTDKVTKYQIEKVEGFNYYVMETVENCIALIYEQKIEELVYHELYFQTFDTDKQMFVPSDDIISVNCYKIGDTLWSDIKYGDFTISMDKSMCDIPLGLTKNGNLIIKHYWMMDDTYGEYDRNGKQVNYGHCGNNDTLYQNIHMVGNEMTTWDHSYNYDLDMPEYVICKVGLNKGDMTEDPYIFMRMDTVVSLYEEDADIPDECLTMYLLVTLPGDTGPMHYTIMDNGEIFILDDMREDAPIKHYSKDGEYIETIYSSEFSGFDYGFVNITAVGNKLYLMPSTEYEPVTGYLCEYDPETKTIERYAFPDEVVGHHEDARALVVIGKYLVFDSFLYDKTIWMFDTEKHEFITDTSAYSRTYDNKAGGAVVKTDGREYFIPIPQNGEVYPLGFDNDGNIIVHYIYDSISYRKYTPDRKLLAFAEETYEDEDYYIGYPERVVNGELVRSRTTKEVYSIDKVVFNEDYFKAKYDINFDGAENTGDAVIILRYAVELTEFTRAQTVKADINCDCKINTGDAVAVLKYCVGM